MDDMVCSLLQHVSKADDQGLDANAVGSSSLFSSDEELFAFARCVSRLNQMGSVSILPERDSADDPGQKNGLSSLGLSTSSPSLSIIEYARSC
jgi:hypothetical protein